METIDDLALYFFIACGVSGLLFFLLFILVVILFHKINRLVREGSNQLNFQRDAMADFCFANPMIVPGEELSRRGFSMYRGSDPLSLQSSTSLKNNNDYPIFNESRSKF